MLTLFVSLNALLSCYDAYHVYASLRRFVKRSVFRICPWSTMNINKIT